jgi:hypothetical protein
MCFSPDGRAPRALLSRLHQMSPEQIADLVRLIRAWLAGQPR